MANSISCVFTICDTAARSWYFREGGSKWLLLLILFSGGGNNLYLTSKHVFENVGRWNCPVPPLYRQSVCIESCHCMFHRCTPKRTFQRCWLNTEFFEFSRNPTGDKLGDGHRSKLIATIGKCWALTYAILAPYRRPRNNKIKLCFPLVLLKRRKLSKRRREKVAAAQQKLRHLSISGAWRDDHRCGTRPCTRHTWKAGRRCSWAKTRGRSVDSSLCEWWR